MGLNTFIRMGSLNIHILLILCSSHMGSRSRISKQKIVTDEKTVMCGCLEVMNMRLNRVNSILTICAKWKCDFKQMVKNIIKQFYSKKITDI